MNNKDGGLVCRKGQVFKFPVKRVDATLTALSATGDVLSNDRAAVVCDLSFQVIDIVSQKL